MSGICGIYSPSNTDLATPEILARMLDAISHRGSAARRQFVDEQAGVAIGHVFAPSFQAPGEQTQPNWYEDDDYVATLDGAIFGAPGLASQESRTRDRDRECAIAVEHLRRHPADFPAKLDGHFALTLWNKAERTLWLARDAIGGKPLYYHYVADTGVLLFASEPKGILAHPSVTRRLCPEAFVSYLTFGYVLAPLSIFGGMRKVFPGEVLRSGADGRLHIRQFWRVPQFKPAPGELKDFAAELRVRFTQTVAKYVEGAQQLGVLFSGGIESTIVLGILKQLGIKDLHTFTLGFLTDAGKKHLAGDLPWAERLAHQHQTTHHPVVVTNGHSPCSLLPRIFRQFDEPMLTPNCYSKFLLSAAAQQVGINSCVSGSNAEPSFQRNWAKTIRKVHGAIGSDASFEDFLLHNRTKLFSFDEQAQLLTDPIADARDMALDIIRRYSSDVEADYIGDRIDGTLLRMQDAEKSIAVQDRTAALNGVEIRHPFHDEQLVQFSNLIPARFKGSESDDMVKAVLIEAFRDLVPADVSSRKKVGFPSYYWTNGEVEHWQSQLLSPAGLERTGLFRPDAVRKVLEADRTSTRKSAGQQTWGLMVAQVWFELYMNRHDELFTEPEALVTV